MKIDYEFDRQIKEAFVLYHDLLCAALPKKEELQAIHPSEKFNQRMAKLLRRQQKFYYNWVNTVAKRVACVLIILFLAAATTTFSVEAFREPFLRFITETFEKYTEIFFPEDEEETLFEPTLPTYIPERFRLVSDASNEDSVMLIYADSTQNSLIITQHPKGTHLAVDNEEVTYERLMIHKIYEGIYSEKYDEGYLVFANDDYLYEIAGDLTKDEILMIAESIPVKP